MLEEWKVVKEAPRYSVSNLGRVMVNATGKIRKHKITCKGYHELGLTTSGGSVYRRVHRLVAEEFIPRPAVMVDAKGNPRDQVDHIDVDKSNNTVANLRWCSNEENTDFRYGLTKEAREKVREEDAKNYATAKRNEAAKRKRLAEVREADRRASMLYGSTANMIKATAKSVEVNGIEYQSAREAAKVICEDVSVTAKVDTVRKEIQKYVQGRRQSWLMYGKYKIGN